MYEVDYILCKKRFNGRWLYLVKWSDFEYSECTWEPIENIVTAKKPYERFLEGTPIDQLKQKMEKYEKDLKTYESVEKKYNKYKNIVDYYVTKKERELDNIAKINGKNKRNRSRSLVRADKVIDKQQELRSKIKRSDSSDYKDCIGLLRRKRAERSRSSGTV